MYLDRVLDVFLKETKETGKAEGKTRANTALHGFYFIPRAGHWQTGEDTANMVCGFALGKKIRRVTQRSKRTH